VDDLADAAVFLTREYAGEEIVNVGVGHDLTIGELAQLVGEVVGFGGGIVYDATKPDGTPRKLLDVSRLTKLGWQARIPLRQGVAEVYQWFLENQDAFRE
jgi:GDP-L-fucose synthase